MLKALSAQGTSGTHPMVSTISQVTRPCCRAHTPAGGEEKREKQHSSKKRPFPFCSPHSHSQPWLSLIPITLFSERKGEGRMR